MSSFSDIVDQLKQNNRSEVDQLKENNTSEVEQLKKNNRSEAGRDGRHTMALNEINTTLGNQTTNLMELAENAKSSSDVPPTELKPKTIEDEETDDKNKSLAEAITNSKVFKGISGVLGKVGGFLGGLLKGVADKGKGLLGTLFKAAGLGLLIAFLNSDTFKNFFSEENIKALQASFANFIDRTKEVFNSFFGEEGGIAKGFVELGKYVLLEYPLFFAGLAAMLAPGLVFAGLKLLITTAIIKPLAFVGAKLGFAALFAKLGAGLLAIKTTLVSTFAVPLLPFIAVAAAVGLVFTSLVKSFEDFKTTLDETGSIWEASKAGIISFFSNLLGLPFDLIKMGISWVIGKVGDIFGIESFQNASKVLDDFSFVETLKGIFGKVFKFIGEVMDSIVGAIKKVVNALNPFSEDEKTPEEIAAEEEKQRQLARAAEVRKRQQELNRVANKRKRINNQIKAVEKDIASDGYFESDANRASDVERLEQLKQQRTSIQQKEAQLQSVGMSPGAMGGAITIVNSVNKGGDSTTNMTSTSESLVNGAVMGVPDQVALSH